MSNFQVSDVGLRSESAIKILRILKDKNLRFSQIYARTRLKPLIIHRQIECLSKMELIGENNEHFYITPKGRDLLNRLQELMELRF